MPERSYDFDEELPFGSILFHSNGQLVAGIEVSGKRQGQSDRLRYQVKLLRGARLSVRQGRYWLLKPEPDQIELIRIALYGRRKEERSNESAFYRYSAPFYRWENLALAYGVPELVKDDLFWRHPSTICA